MKIQILPKDEYIVESKDCPVVGRSYFLEDEAEGTQRQNKAFHALVQEYWKTGQHSYNVDNFDDFRNQIKRSLGEGFQSFIYVEMIHPVMGLDSLIKPKIMDAKKYEDIPEAIRKDPDMKNLIRGKLKSWADYTKKQRINCVDNLIAEMHEAGVNSKKFNEILEGMEEEKNGK